VANGEFRQDLYYRISGFPIDLPPLQERRENIELLAKILLTRIKTDRRHTLFAAAIDCLKAYTFPGNIRDLRNILERANLLANCEYIKPEHLPQECQEAARAYPDSVGYQDFLPGDDIIPLKQVEGCYLQWARQRHRGDQRSLAKLLGLSERTLYRKLEGLLTTNNGD